MVELFSYLEARRSLLNKPYYDMVISGTQGSLARNFDNDFSELDNLDDSFIRELIKELFSKKNSLIKDVDNEYVDFKTTNLSDGKSFFAFLKQAKTSIKCNYCLKNKTYKFEVKEGITGNTYVLDIINDKISCLDEEGNQGDKSQFAKAIFALKDTLFRSQKLKK